MRAVALPIALALVACGRDVEPAAPPEASTNDAAEAQPATRLSGCPFRQTADWAGSVEGGRLLVTGRVDLMMAGMRPTLTPRAGAPAGTLALDLTLEPDPEAAIQDNIRYEARGAPPYRRGEIWCGGERIESFPVTVVG